MRVIRRGSCPKDLIRKDFANMDPGARQRIPLEQPPSLIWNILIHGWTDHLR